ncbi:TetR/AcrR family transcriptional regulator [Amycolatopsis sp. CA-230715]|uniref:TetR/AcrR family transcriptional regulator n=1 Tax=Amycolatopsis sp. CA-230715 TaxID=2745196 RepID=UPI001C017992|nr:TetR/AcrR family transcriptional regulator [Amycolatopsis sp. CA-230715]
MDDINGPQSGYASDEILHVGRKPPKERADAARNRERIVEAAERLFAAHGVDAVSMDQIAAEAGVGKGTVFRRFGDKSGLAAELLGAREAELQEAAIRGGPPLGPGAPAGARLVAFLRAYAEFLDANLDLVHMSETASAGARYRIGAYAFWHQHVALLLREARPGGDADLFAHLLLAPLAAEQRKALAGEFSLSRLSDGVAALAALVVTGDDRADEL